jgi:sarcosine oxidase subunit alpha
MRGACDGCLVRVDGEPNVLSCMTKVRDGAKVESQNTLGTRKVDLLRVTDWFFPEGMNHHELFAGVPGVSSIMQVFARRVAGLGKLPTEVLPSKQATRRQVDVLVVGAGPSGLAIAAELASSGRTVELVDDAVTRGGSLRSLSPSALRPFQPMLARVESAEKQGSLVIRSQTTVGGIFGDDALTVGPDGAEILEARALVLAPGAHDGVLAFEGNDVPGVMSARALGLLLSLGIAPGERLTVVDAGGDFTPSVKELAAGLKLDAQVVVGEPTRVIGTGAVRGVVVRDAAGKEHEHACDILAIDSPTAPAYELCEQAGARLVHESRGYVVQTEKGRIRDGIWALGEACGTALSAAALLSDAEVLARQIAAAAT